MAALGSLAAGACLRGAAAATYIEASVTQAGASSHEATRYNLYLQDDMLRVEDPEGQVTLLVNDKLDVLDTTQQTYAHLDHSTLSLLSPDTQRLREAIESRSVGFPPAQQALAMHYLNRVAPAREQQDQSVQPHATGQTETLESKTYPVWQSEAQGRPETQYLLWVSPAPGVLEDWTTSVRSVDRLTAGLAVPQGMGSLLRLIMRDRDLAQLPGVPVLIREFAPNGQLRSQMRLRFSSIKPLPRDRFAVPAGYHAEITTSRFDSASR